MRYSWPVSIGRDGCGIQQFNVSITSFLIGHKFMCHAGLPRTIPSAPNEVRFIAAIKGFAAEFSELQADRRLSLKPIRL
jgi:hypothetical protein